MTIPTLTALSLSFLALCASIVALFVALRTSGRSLSRQLRAHSEQLSDVAHELEAINNRFRTVNSRINAAAASRKASEDAMERRTATIDPEEEKDRWQRETNLRIARGDFSRR